MPGHTPPTRAEGSFTSLPCTGLRPSVSEGKKKRKGNIESWNPGHAPPLTYRGGKVHLVPQAVTEESPFTSLYGALNYKLIIPYTPPRRPNVNINYRSYIS